MIANNLCRQKRLDEARRVADTEIQAYKKKLEENFENQKRIEYGDMGDQEEIEAETQDDIEKIKQDYNENQEHVVEFLIDSVVNVNLEIPKVVRGDFESG